MGRWTNRHVKTRHGKKRPYKRKGHRPLAKAYRQHVRDQILAGLGNTSNGDWVAQGTQTNAFKNSFAGTAGRSFA